MNITEEGRLEITRTVASVIDTLQEGRVIKLYILPSVQRKDEDQKRYSKTRDVAWVEDGQVDFLILNHELGNPDLFSPGQLVCIDKNKVGYTVRKSIGKRIYAVEFKGTKFTKGQSILVTAAVGSGKTTTTTKLARDIARNLTNSVSFRTTFGERMDDRLYGLDEEDETIDTNSSAPIELQLENLFRAVALALDNAHRGKDAVLVVDSMTRLIAGLTGLFSESHMVSGGIGHEVTDMVANFLRMGGAYGTGTLTVIGTCLFSPTNNTWKAIYDLLSSAANGEIRILKLTKGIGFDVSTRRPPEVVYPYINVFGYKLHY